MITAAVFYSCLSNYPNTVALTSSHFRYAHSFCVSGVWTGQWEQLVSVPWCVKPQLEKLKDGVA